MHPLKTQKKGKENPREKPRATPLKKLAYIAVNSGVSF
jgi:hypothetical protein